MDIGIRDGTIDDLDDLAEIYRVHFQYDITRSLKKFLEDNSKYVVRVATLKDKIVGYVVVHLENKNVAHILLVIVHPNYWRRKIGTKLLRDVITILKRMHFRIIYLEVSTGNVPARMLYEKMGFRIADLKMHYYLPKEGVIDDAYVMIKKLD